jgi:hypothetical protein
MENQSVVIMLIGRNEEQRLLLSLLESDKSEFVAVYGRRRVGKTYLVREAFNYKFSFQHAGIQDATMKEQLEEFHHSLLLAGVKGSKRPRNWSQAFFMLGQHLAALPDGKKVVFIDELPWLDTPCSKFVTALDHFWNGWASARKDIVLVVCGSATSWIIDNIVMNYGGLHNRLTRQIYIEPFTLHECELYAQSKRLGMNRRNILETYMVMGGIPFYWDFLQKELSWAQNIDRMFFHRNGEMRREFNALYSSLFRHPQAYIDVVTALGTKKAGMTRTEIIEALGENNGGTLTKILSELEECDFIRSYNALGKMKKETVYQLIDNFTLFYFKFMAGKDINDKNYWSSILKQPIYNTWSGLAFERVCFQHIDQIKKALGIAGVVSNVHSWTYHPKNKQETGVQIDMLIDRDDNVINLCEMKFAKDEYEITAAYDAEMRRKTRIFESKTGTRKAVTIVMITSYGLVRNEWANDIQRQVVMDDLFEA